MHDQTRPAGGPEDRFRELIEKAPDGVLVVRPDGGIVFANPAAGALLGRDPGELVGAPFGQPLAAGETTEIDLFSGRGAGAWLLPLRVAEMRVALVEWDGGP